MNVTYFSYVFFNGAGKFLMEHSGVHSPAITLDPKYGNSRESRINAIASLSRYPDSQTAMQALEWVSLNDEDIAVRLAACDALKALPATTPQNGMTW